MRYYGMFDLSSRGMGFVAMAGDAGAFVAQVTRIHQDWVHTIVIGAVVAGLLYLTRSTIQNRLGGSKF